MNYERLGAAEFISLNYVVNIQNIYERGVSYV